MHPVPCGYRVLYVSCLSNSPVRAAAEKLWPGRNTRLRVVSCLTITITGAAVSRVFGSERAFPTGLACSTRKSNEKPRNRHLPLSDLADLP